MCILLISALVGEHSITVCSSGVVGMEVIFNCLWANICVSGVDSAEYNYVCEVTMSISFGRHGPGWCTVDIWLRVHMASE